MLGIRDLRLEESQYHNMLEKGLKRTKEEEVRYALATLVAQGYHVRVRENYVIEGDIRQAREIRNFFLCGNFQIIIGY